MGPRCIDMTELYKNYVHSHKNDLRYEPLRWLCRKWGNDNGLRLAQMVDGVI